MPSAVMILNIGDGFLMGHSGARRWAADVPGLGLVRHASERIGARGRRGVDRRPVHVFVVTHEPPTDWKHAATARFTFVTDGVEAAIERARAFAGDDRIVPVSSRAIA